MENSIALTASLAYISDGTPMTSANITWWNRSSLEMRNRTQWYR